MAKKRYGINIGFIRNAGTIPSTAAVHIHDQQDIAGGGGATDTHFGIVFTKGNFYNAISWGDIDTPLTLRSLYIKDSDNGVYKNVGGTETKLLETGEGGPTYTAGNGISTAGDIISTFSVATLTAQEDITIENTATETTLLSGALAGSINFPANYIQPGSVIRIHARGTFGTDAASAPNLTFRVYLNSVEILSTGAVTLGLGYSGSWWTLDGLVSAYSDGATGAFVGRGSFVIPSTSSSNIMLNLPMSTNSTVDTTASQDLDITVEWSAADLDNTITIESLLVEILDPQGGLF